jgi:hypothetical protein
MKKINLRTVADILSDPEMKRVLGGRGPANCSECTNTCDYCTCQNHAGAWYQCHGDKGFDWACGDGTGGKENIDCNPYNDD